MIGPALPTEVLDAVPLAVVVVGGGGTVVAANRAAEVLYGHGRGELVGRDVAEALFHPDDREQAAARLARAEPWEGDARVQRRDGALLVSSFRLVPVAGGVAWVATDGLDQGLAEAERVVLEGAEHAARATAEEALGLIEAILSSAPVAIAVLDLQLRYVRVNDAYAALSGVPAEEHIGGSLGAIVAPAVSVVADVRRALATGRTILGRDVEIPSGGGSRHFTVSYFPVRSPSGAVVGAGLAGVEITALKRTEAERSALLEAAEAARRRLSIVAAASTVLSTTMDIEELLGRLARALVPAAGDWCVVALLPPAGAARQVAASHRDPELAAEAAAFVRSASVASSSLVASAAQSGLPALVERRSLPALWGHPPSGRLAEAVPARAIVAPFTTRDGLAGVLVLGTDGDRPLDADDVELAVEVAHRAALGVGNARAYQQEHQIAETLQRAMLPPSVPSMAQLDVAVRYLAAADGTSVGGDWYDVLPFDDASATIVVGDVVGHDLAASTAMAQLRSVLQAFTYDGHAGPGPTLARVDGVWGALGLAYATCVVGHVDAGATNFRWSNAGHPPPVLVRAGEARQVTGGAGTMLGVGAPGGRPEASMDLEPGDVLVLYTDGLVERRGEGLDAGLARLERAAAGAPAGAGAEEVCDHLVESMLGSERPDDVAIVVARVAAPRGGDEHRLAFDPEPGAAATLRGYVAGLLEARGWSAQVDAAVLLVTELAANAVRHAGGPCALVVAIGPDEVELAVEDGDPGLPSPRRADDLDEAGRGLLLVEALASAWGVRRVPGGKATWAVLRRDRLP